MKQAGNYKVRMAFLKILLFAKKCPFSHKKKLPGFNRAHVLNEYVNRRRVSQSKTTSQFTW